LEVAAVCEPGEQQIICRGRRQAAARRSSAVSLSCGHTVDGSRNAAIFVNRDGVDIHPGACVNGDGVGSGQTGGSGEEIGVMVAGNGLVSDLCESIAEAVGDGDGSIQIRKDADDNEIVGCDAFAKSLARCLP
jgi:hypothetical protein